MALLFAARLAFPCGFLAMKTIPFTKAEANGNDFLLVERGQVPAAERAVLTRELCDRHAGVGADGVEFYAWIEGQLQLTLHNADGREAEISGNGTRCAAAFAARHYQFCEGLIVTACGPKWTRVTRADTGDGLWRLESRLGQPEFRPERIPMNDSSDRVIERAVPQLGGIMTAVSLGNPHACVEVTEFPVDWQARAAAFQATGIFPQGVNVEYYRVTGPQAIEIRIFERGVGETRSSGTGSSAAAVAALARGRVSSPVLVTSPGGTQSVSWEPAGDAVEVRLEGPARLIAEGLFFRAET